MANLLTDQTDAPVEGWQPVISPDGSKVAFASYRFDLVRGDTNNQPDIYVEDLTTRTVARLSNDATGAASNGKSLGPVFSPDGTKVAFVSNATNLVQGDTNGMADFFIADLSTGEVQRVATGAAYEPDFDTPRLVFSPDGSKILFRSLASDLVPGDTNNHNDIFLKDLATGVVTRVSIGEGGAQAISDSSDAVFSPDGTRIAFSSAASNLVAGDTNGAIDVFVKDLATGTIECIGSALHNGSTTSAPVFSPGGTHLAFRSGNGVFLYDLATGERTAAFQEAFGRLAYNPIFSPDGTKTAFWASIFGVSGMAVFVKDWVTGGLMVATPPPGDLIPGTADLSWVGNTLAYTATQNVYLQAMSIVAVAPLDAVKPEGNWGETTFTFTLTRSGELSAYQSIRWGVSAVPYDDPGIWSTPRPGGEVTFAPGETTKTIAVQVAADGFVEPDQHFLVTLFDPDGGLIYDTALVEGVILNDDSIVHADAFIVTPGQTLQIRTTIPTDPNERLGVLANDQLTDPVTVSLVHGPAHGTLAFGTDGHFDYTPDPGFTGIDRFTYNADDSLGQGNGEVLLYIVPEIVGPATTLDLPALTPEEQIAATYVAFFNRGADAPGFQFWLNQFHAGQETQGPTALLANIASSFAISSEAKTLYPFIDHLQDAQDFEFNGFVNTIYSSLFGRSPDAAGLAYWSERLHQTLEQGGFVGSVLVDVMSGAQNTPGGAQDITRLMGKVAVGFAYVAEQQQLGTSWTEDQRAEAIAMMIGISDKPETVLMGIAYAENVVLAHALASLGGA
ncbi:MAG: DUF4214 domain-containing protein [Reyranella sp.]|uniref:DUF4214 domain-containing protein n=1 Tax=Reyranella sp. TaxID=1929291 RepID=UPI003D0F57D5